MDQPALDRRLGTVGANPPCCFRTATHLVTHSSKIWPETPATSRFNRHSPDKGGRLRSLLFFTLQPHRPKTRHQRWRPDWLAGHVRFELRNVVANYPFEKSRRFAAIQPNFGHGDHSRLSCGVGDTQLGARFCRDLDVGHHAASPRRHELAAISFDAP